MAGPQDIQRYPRGLIDLLGMRATGQTPTQLGSDVRGNLELLDFYLNDRMQILSQISSSVITPGLYSYSNLAPPNGQIWLLYQLTLSSVSTAAGQGAIITGGITRQQVSANAYFALTDRQDWGALAQANVGFVAPGKPVILQPGDVITMRCSGIITAAPAVGVTATIYYASIGI